MALGELNVFGACLYLAMPIVYFSVPVLLQIFVFCDSGSHLLATATRHLQEGLRKFRDHFRSLFALTKVFAKKFSRKFLVKTSKHVFRKNTNTLPLPPTYPPPLRLPPLL